MYTYTYIHIHRCTSVHIYTSMHMYELFHIQWYVHSVEKVETTDEQSDMHESVPLIERRWTQDDLFLTGNCTLSGTRTCQKFTWRQDGSQTPGPVAPCPAVFPCDCLALISCPVFPRCLCGAELGSQTDSDPWPWESPQRVLGSCSEHAGSRKRLHPGACGSFHPRKRRLPLRPCVCPFHCPNLPENCHMWEAAS